MKKGNINVLVGCVNVAIIVSAIFVSTSFFSFLSQSDTFQSTNMTAFANTIPISTDTPPTEPKITETKITKTKAKVETFSVTSLSDDIRGNIIDAGIPAYTELGIVYATTRNPTTADNKKVISGGGTGNFRTDLPNLTDNTPYYVRTYAKNEAGTAYGNEITIFNFEMVAVEGGQIPLRYFGKEGNDIVDLKDFKIGKYEVTQAQWKAVMGNSNNPSYFKGDNLPVDNVSMVEVKEFIDSLNLKTGKQYRLPTEIEWEFAARSGNKRTQNYKFSGSDTLTDVAWNRDNSEDKTHPFGEKKSNELGIYDMSGNVAEWCNKHVYINSVLHYILRGGSFNSLNACQVDQEYSNEPHKKLPYNGFRLVLP